MPTYQYVCTECGTPLEAVQSFTDAALTDCPTCHGQLRKVFSAVGVVFKGSGFYKNDSRSSAKGGGDKAPAGDKGGQGDKGGAGDKPATTTPAKTDSTPAAKPAPASSSGASPKSTSST